MARRASEGTSTLAATPVALEDAPAEAVRVEPLVEQLAEGDATADVVRPASSIADEPEWLYDTVQHKLGCPMREAPLQGTDGRPGRLQRMEYSDLTEPRSLQNPLPRTYRVVRCLDCSNGAKIKLPRDDD